MDIIFFLNSILFGVGLAMDAFSVSVVDGLNEPEMKRGKAMKIAGTFCFFQIAMPLLGWLFVSVLSNVFSSFQRWTPYIALILLLYIGGKMLYEGLKHSDGEPVSKQLSGRVLLLQGIATSIDALSVGFTIAEYSWQAALVEALIIGAVTFGISMLGLVAGKKLGTRVNDKASLLGGIILILIGIEIFIKGVF